jgi:hypothetical protein
MGALADAMMAYAQPLVDETDGSMDQMNYAIGIDQLCWNFSLFPEEDREETINEMQQSLEMGDEEFREFKQTVIFPMIWRHEKMFPQMHRKDSLGMRSSMLHLQAPRSEPRDKYPGTGRNAPCPCNSGRKYKLCCGRHSAGSMVLPA